MAMAHNPGLQLAESDVRAKEFRLKGERRGYFPTLELVSVYSVLGKFNNYTQFFRTFQRNNFNAGIDAHIPIFSAKMRADIGLARINLEAAKVNLTNKKTELTADVRQKTGGCAKEMRPKRWRGWNCSSRSKRCGVSIAVCRGEVESPRSRKSAAGRERKVDGVSGCKLSETAGAAGIVKDGGQLDKVWQ